LKKKGVKEERRITSALDDIGTSTPLESNKSLFRHPRTPSSPGDVLYVDPAREAIAWQEFAGQVFQPR